MLGYILGHGGKVKEQVACKFTQIGSALDYCHLNNVVHRGRPHYQFIHNRADFLVPFGRSQVREYPHITNRQYQDGLANLYDPFPQLSTFCGSYFPTPELVSGEPYTGPEVDVWSLAIVLSLLVCGDVPFDH